MGAAVVIRQRTRKCRRVPFGSLSSDGNRKVSPTVRVHGICHHKVMGHSLKFYPDIHPNSFECDLDEFIIQRVTRMTATGQDILVNPFAPRGCETDLQCTKGVMTPAIVGNTLQNYSNVHFHNC